MNCLIRCVCKKSFLSFPCFSMVIKKICKIKTNLSKIRKALPPPPPLQLNFCHCICVAIFIILESQSKTLWHQNYKLRHQLKLQVTPTKLQVTPTKLQVTRSKFTSLRADTKKFQLTNMVFITS